MAWNEPGKDKKPDPWGGGQNNRNNNPPDFEQMIKKFFKNFGRMLGAKSGGGGSSGGGDFSSPYFFAILASIAVIALLVWAVNGINIIQQGEQAAVLRFGKFSRILEPGPHWAPPIMDKVTKVNTQRVSIYRYDAEMLTRDANIVNVAVAVHFRILDLRNYLFSVVNPRESLQQATASALRQVVGHTDLDTIMTTGRTEVRQQVQDQLEKILASYKTGIIVTDVNMQQAKAPEAVKEAFNNAIKAQEREQQYINEAQAYAKGVVPKAEGHAKRLLAEAGAYKKETVLKAQGLIARYLSLLPEYARAPQVTRERLYLDTVESVLGQSSKILLDTKGSNNVLYLPLERIIKANQQADDQANVQAAMSKAVDDSVTGKIDLPKSVTPISRDRYSRDNYTGRG